MASIIRLFGFQSRIKFWCILIEKSSETCHIFITKNVLRYEHVAGFGELNYQNTPKLDARLKAK